MTVVSTPSTPPTIVQDTAMFPTTSPLDRLFLPLQLGDPSVSEAVERAAQAIDQMQGAAPGSPSRTAIVASLCVGELVSEMDDADDMLRLLHLVARRLARADAEAAWTGLLAAPFACTPGWLDKTGLDQSPVWHLGAEDGRHVAADCDLPDVRPLQGFTRMFAMPAVSAPSQPPQSSRTFSALVSGLLCGVSERLVEEAHDYARTRLSGGKPINQYQAVALRLAELDMGLQALLLSAAAPYEPALALETAEACRPPLLADLAFAIARDAVQVAAAHGYVEGLPFKRLFSQSRTLASLLLVIDAAGHTGNTRVH